MSFKYSTGTVPGLFFLVLGVGFGCRSREPSAVAAQATDREAVNAASTQAPRTPTQALGPASTQNPEPSSKQSQEPVVMHSASELTWSYPQTAIGPMRVVVSIPAHVAGERLPVLFAFHGRGEALKGPERGARGWWDDYWLGKAIQKLAHPPLDPELFLGFADPVRLQAMNESLRARPYAGLIVVTPYTPDRLGGDDAFAAAKPLSAWVVDELLPRVYRETPALGTYESTGIDGVSLGGRAAWAIGLSYPEKFGVVSGMQAAFDSEEGEWVARVAEKAVKKKFALKLRLLTSGQDYYLEPSRALSARLTGLRVPHRFDVVRGTHSYTFNRGPGAYEMLLFHDRALRGLPSP